MSQGYANRSLERVGLDRSHVAKTRIVSFEENLDVAHFPVAVFRDEDFSVACVLPLFHLAFAMKQQDDIRILFE